MELRNWKRKRIATAWVGGSVPVQLLCHRIHWTALLLTRVSWRGSDMSTTGQTHRQDYRFKLDYAQFTAITEVFDGCR